MTAIFTFIRLGRTGGTTDADLRACARFVFGRPGWAVEEGTTQAGGTCLRLWTQGYEGRQPEWRIERLMHRLVAVHESSGQTAGPAATMQEILMLVWEAGQGCAVAA